MTQTQTHTLLTKTSSYWQIIKKRLLAINDGSIRSSVTQSLYHSSDLRWHVQTIPDQYCIRLESGELLVELNKPLVFTTTTTTTRVIDKHRRLDIGACGCSRKRWRWRLKLSRVQRQTDPQTNVYLHWLVVSDANSFWLTKYIPTVKKNRTFVKLPTVFLSGKFFKTSSFCINQTKT